MQIVYEGKVIMLGTCAGNMVGIIHMIPCDGLVMISCMNIVCYLTISSLLYFQGVAVVLVSA